MTALYNDTDAFVAQWMRNLIGAGHIAEGVVDERSITDLRPSDVVGHRQFHAFGGIGGWSCALRLAGVPDDADVWTGSCPCQPFSDAGTRSGTRDPRHLWPAWFALIEQCRPPIIFGEQVASKDGLAWLDLVFADLERCGYAVGAADLSAASIGAPHIRQRLYFMACADTPRWLQQWQRRLREVGDAQPGRDVDGCGEADRMGDADRHESVRRAWRGEIDRAQTQDDGTSSRRVDRPDGNGALAASAVDIVADFMRDGPQGREQAGSASRPVVRSDDCAVGYTSGARREWPTNVPRILAEQRGACARLEPWSDIEWVPCVDGTSRPVEPGLEPLAHGISGRMAVRRTVQSSESANEETETHWYNRTGALSGLGNAIIPQLAATFIESALEAIADRNHV